MNIHIDHLIVETESEWHLSGWAFVSDEIIWYGRLEIAGQTIGPISCGSARPDVLEAFQASCPTVHVGFCAHIVLPSGLPGGEHRLDLIFFNRNGFELGRVGRKITLERDVPKGVSHESLPWVDSQHPQARYLDLLEKTLLGIPYAEDAELLVRYDGQDWPGHAHSMIGQQRMRHLRACAETALEENVPGDFIETGVWRGGACIMLRGVLQAYEEHSRKVWVADSFAGLPQPDEEKYPADSGDILYTFKELAIPLERVKGNFARYGLLDDQVRFLKGLFSQTMPKADIAQLAVLRLDGDMYESTMDVLTHLYPKLSRGGFCVIDDYGAIPACRQAVRDYRAEKGIHAPVSMIDWTGAFWRKD
ncbi:TylF/MycF family methyltransferase [Verrucomicrobium spinosum]|uniref:TylF/MycF family methyltransferase n=1 Tax=Verrucomicrobium spinosum TaxID=2736 RepID=UPI0002DE37AD|nr:TylF/MycF family methyltransferase [Verrucomicrobium spinosum]